MNVKELVALARDQDPERLGGMADARAAALLRAAFAVIRAQLEEAGPGPFKVGGLGTFRIRDVEYEQDGEVYVERRVVFKAMQPRN